MNSFAADGFRQSMGACFRASCAGRLLSAAGAHLAFCSTMCQLSARWALAVMHCSAGVVLRVPLPGRCRCLQEMHAQHLEGAAAVAGAITATL